MPEQKPTLQTENTFVLLKDLTPNDVKKLELLKVKLIRGKANSGRLTGSIVVNVQEQFMKQLSLRDGSSFLSIDKFNRILLHTNVPLVDKDNRPITEWNIKVPVRFVKGNYKNRDEQYYALEVIFGKGLYVTHFFDYDQSGLLDSLQEKGLLKIKWIDRPDAIEFEEFQKLDFN